MILHLKQLQVFINKKCQLLDMSDEEILVKYFGGRPQWSGNKLYKINGERVEWSGDKVYRIGGKRF